MTLGSSHFLNGAMLALLAGAVAAACGSDAGHHSLRSEEGGAGAGGGGGVPHAGGAGTKPQPLGGNGGEPEPVVVGGNGGAPAVVTAGEGGVPAIALGGVPSVSAGEGGMGGVPDTLPPVNCDTIVITDPNLEAAVRSALAKPTGAITPQEAASLTALGSSQFSGITSIAGIECFTGVTDLYLGVGGQASNVQNLAPLRYLKNLTSLDLNNNALTTLEPLGKLPNLQALNLVAAVKHLDLGPLATAPALTTLQLNKGLLDDLTPLSKISTLRDLELNGATLSAPASLSTLKKITELHLASVITDATPVAALTQLKILDISQKPLTNFDKLSTLVNLTTLDASYADVSSITAVGSMTKLTDLNLAFDAVADISALQGLTQLKNFSANFDPITDITPLVNNAGIGTGDVLNLAGTSLSCATQGAKVTTLVGRGATVYSPCN